MPSAPTEIAIHKRKGAGAAQRMGFFTDTTTCIGCKACEVACKQWNDLPADELRFGKGHSYDYTNALSASTWRHVRFVETVKPTTAPEQVSASEDLPDLVELAAGNLASAPLGGDAGESGTQLDRWVFMSDVDSTAGTAETAHEHPSEQPEHASQTGQSVLTRRPDPAPRQS